MAETPTPLFRKLRIFALDPSLGSSLKTYELRTDTIPVRYEHRPAFKPGPVGEYLEVVDVDPASNRFYAPVDLQDLRIMAIDGLEPSEGNPQFHQQMVYAVAMRTIEIFEQALGRVVLWQPRRPGTGAKRRDWIYVQRLRLYPHALRAQNAFYSPQRGAILFGYFPSEASDDAMTPGGTMVFSCLSSDIIAHEMTHAILDGAARGYRENSNPDVLAFHEGFADIVALFEHFMYPDLVASEIARARGTSAMDLLSGLAKQFGESTQRGGALRDYSKFPDTVTYRNSFEVHERGSILVKAVYDAFTAIVERRCSGLIELATEGSGVLKPGALHPNLVARLADETIRAARHVLRMCVRAIDYCPPVDIDFGTYFRALITADLAQVDEDRFNYRTAFLESFRKWGLLPRNLRTVSLETISWQHPPKECLDPDEEERANTLIRSPDWLPGLVKLMEIDWLGDLKRKRIFHRAERRRFRVHDYLADCISRDSHVAAQLGLQVGLPKYLDERDKDGNAVVDPEWKQRTAGLSNPTNFSVANARASRRVRPDGSPRDEIVVVITQREPKELSNGDPYWFRGGATLIINPRGESGPEIRYAVMRSTLDRKREVLEHDYREGESSGLRLAYFGRALESREPFALLHAPGDVYA
ncbi:MAG TPA: hypothetical protein VE989_07780 [Sphingomicrobium sp.]|nr:hypothetical protein [Sphingomicrobium sp.]